MIVPISLGGFVADQMQYNLESYYIISKYTLVFIYILEHRSHIYLTESLPDDCRYKTAKNR